MPHTCHYQIKSKNVADNNGFHHVTDIEGFRCGYLDRPCNYVGNEATLCQYFKQPFAPTNALLIMFPAEAEAIEKQRKRCDTVKNSIQSMGITEEQCKEKYHAAKGERIRLEGVYENACEELASCKVALENKWNELIEKL